MNNINNSVIIKGNKYGIVVVLDDTIDFDELMEIVKYKFTESSSFFKDAKMAISFKAVLTMS